MTAQHKFCAEENSRLLGRSYTGEGASKSITGGDSGREISTPPSKGTMLHQFLAHVLGIAPFVWIRGKVYINNTGESTVRGL